MKKILSFILAFVILSMSCFSLTASAWETPKLSLAAWYNADAQTITVYYRLLNFAGTESADFRLKFASNVLQMTDCIKADMDNVVIESGIKDGEDNVMAIQFVDMYHVEEADCEEDGSATVATITFKVTDTSAEKVSFIAYADSCNMDPDSASVNLSRATLQVPMNGGSTQVSNDSGYVFGEEVTGGELSSGDKTNIKKVIIAAVIVAVVFIVAIAVIVVKYRKKED